MRVEVLVSTMHQKDKDFLEKMNISTDAIVINQTDSEGYGRNFGVFYTVKITIKAGMQGREWKRKSKQAKERSAGFLS